MLRDYMVSYMVYPVIVVVPGNIITVYHGSAYTVINGKNWPVYNQA